MACTLGVRFRKVDAGGNLRRGYRRICFGEIDRGVKDFSIAVSEQPGAVSRVNDYLQRLRRQGLHAQAALASETLANAGVLPVGIPAAPELE